MNLVIKSKDKEVVLDSFKGYYELDKVLANFDSEYDILKNIGSLNGSNEIFVKTTEKQNIYYSSRNARKLLPIFDNQKVDGLLDSLFSSMFNDKANMDIVKDYITEEKIKFVTVNTPYGTDRVKLLNNMLKLLNYSNLNEESITEFKNLFNASLGDKSYAKIRRLFKTLNDFDFVFDESFEKLVENNKYIKNEEEKNKIIMKYKKIVDTEVMKDKQVTIDDLMIEEETEDISFREKNPVFDYNGEKIDEIPFHQETVEKINSLKLRG